MYHDLFSSSLYVLLFLGTTVQIHFHFCIPLFRLLKSFQATGSFHISVGRWHVRKSSFYVLNNDLNPASASKINWDYLTDSESSCKHSLLAALYQYVVVVHWGSNCGVCEQAGVTHPCSLQPGSGPAEVSVTCVWSSIKTREGGSGLKRFIRTITLMWTLAFIQLWWKLKFMRRKKTCWLHFLCRNVSSTNTWFLFSSAVAWPPSASILSLWWWCHGLI